LPSKIAWAGAVVVGLASYMTIASGSPSLLSPLSVVVAIPAMFAFDAFPGSGPLRDVATLGLVPAVFPALFLIWSVPAFRKGPSVPPRSTVLCWSLWRRYQARGSSYPGTTGSVTRAGATPWASW